MNADILHSSIEQELAALPECRPQWVGDRPGFIAENGEPNTGYPNRNSRVEYDRLRTPLGFLFRLNLRVKNSSDLVILRRFLADTQNYVVYRNAYLIDGTRSVDCVVIFQRKSTLLHL